MSTVEFKSACAAHRKCCPYKATGMTKCGANENITPDGKCTNKECKAILRKLSASKP